MKLKIVLLVWIFSVISLVGFSQNLTQTVATADSLMANNQFNQAEILYERALFFADSISMNQIIQKTALCKVALKNYSEAADLYQMANKYEYLDSLYFTNMLKSTLCLVLNNQITEAQKTLTEISYLEAPTYFLKKAYLLTAIVETQNLNFPLAKQNLDSSIGLLSEMDQANLHVLFKINKKKSKISISKSMIYSALLPGLGQVVNGEIGNGVNSFLLNGILITAFVYTGIQYNFFSSFGFYSFFLPRFYFGGIGASKLAAEHKLVTVKKDYLTQYLKIYLKY